MERKIESLKAREIIAVDQAAKQLGVVCDDLSLGEDKTLHIARAMIRLPEGVDALREAELRKVQEIISRIKRSGSIITSPHTEWRTMGYVTQGAAVDFLTGAVELNNVFRENGVGGAEILLPVGIDNIECRDEEGRRRTDFVYDMNQETDTGLTLASKVWCPPTELPVVRVHSSPRNGKVFTDYGFFMTVRYPDGGVPHRHRVGWSSK